MQILILIDVQYLQNVVFSFEKVSNSQNYSSSGPHHPMKKMLSPSKISPPNVTLFPQPLMLFRKPGNMLYFLSVMSVLILREFFNHNFVVEILFS